MEPIDLIAMDMDGTLLVHDNMIPEENIAALREAHRRGIHLALCSGRIPDDMGFFALDMGLPMHILSLNGTCMMDKPLGAIQRSDTIAPDDVRGILALLHALPVAYSLFGGHEIITSMPDISDDELRIIIGKNVTRPGGRTMIRRGGEGEQALADRGVNKLMVFTDGDGAPLQALKARLDRDMPGVEVSSSWVNNIEINPARCNKGTALRALADSLGIPMSHVMALGDNDNDVPMLRAAGYGVAMGNATPAAMAASAYAAPDNESCGVAAAVRCLALRQAVPGVRRL